MKCASNQHLNTMENTNTPATPSTPAATATVDHSKVAIQIATDYCKAKGITQGLTQNQQTGILVKAIEEVTGLELTQPDKVTLFNTLYHLANGSALRQRLESANVLAKSETKGRQVNAAAFLS